MLTGANRTSLGSRRPLLSPREARAHVHGDRRASVFDRIQFLKVSVFDRLQPNRDKELRTASILGAHPGAISLGLNSLQSLLLNGPHLDFLPQ